MNWTNAAPEIFYFAASLCFLLLAMARKPGAPALIGAAAGLDRGAGLANMAGGPTAGLGLANMAGDPIAGLGLANTSGGTAAPTAGAGLADTAGDPIAGAGLANTSGGTAATAPLLLAALGIIVCLASAGAQGQLFIRAFQVDLFSQVFKVLISIGLFLIVSICGGINDISERRQAAVPPDISARRGRLYHAGTNEFYFLLFTCTLALMLLVSAAHLLSIYISLEVSSYSLYILVSLRAGGEAAVPLDVSPRPAPAVGPPAVSAKPEPRSSPGTAAQPPGSGLEAGIKYFLTGTFASAVMLFGMALLYATSGMTYLTDMAAGLPAMIGRPGVAVGLLLTLGGFFFKLAVFPFHFWAPDTYQGAANQVAAYIATASKVAGIAVLVRVAAFAGQGSVYLVHTLVILSVVSMTLGNLAAIVQKDFKRLLAFSTIAHSGYVLIGILVLSPAGYSGAIFYALAILLMKFTAFMVIVELAADGRNLQIEELAGLHRRSPIMALALLVSLFSLAGIPPTIGFTGKFLVFAAAMQKGYVALVIIAMINVVISLYYYLLAIKAAYLLEPAEAMPPLMVSFPKKLLAGASTAVIVFGGFFPYYFIEIARSAARSLTLH